MSADSGVVRFERRGTTAVITFDRPAARNALTWAMYEQLDEALDRVAGEPDLRVTMQPNQFEPTTAMKRELYQSADSCTSVCSPHTSGLAGGRSQYQS